jgi:hypothetical protein
LIPAPFVCKAKPVIWTYLRGTPHIFHCSRSLIKSDLNHGTISGKRFTRELEIS